MKKIFSFFRRDEVAIAWIITIIFMFCVMVMAGCSNRYIPAKYNPTGTPIPRSAFKPKAS